MLKIIDNPGTVFKWNGKVVEAISINEGKRAIEMRFLKPEDAPKCEHCGHSQVNFTFTVIESSPYFQESVEPVETVRGGDSNATNAKNA